MDARIAGGLCRRDDGENGAVRYRDAAHRHAEYFLALAREAISQEDWSRLDADLGNIRQAWNWVSRDRNETDLIIAFGDLAWQLFEAIRFQLYETIKELEKIKLATMDAAMISKVLRKLDEIARTQSNIQSALRPNVSASGDRSVAATNIVNSIVITGDNARLQQTKKEEMEK